MCTHTGNSCGYAFHAVGWSDRTHRPVRVEYQMPGVIEVPDDADDLSHSELVKRSLVGNFNYKITHDGNGNYQAVAAE